MTRAISLYLGWNNPRTALKVDGYPAVVLVDPATRNFKTLAPQASVDFHAQVTELSHHLCGIKASARAQALLTQVKHPDDAYDIIFDRFFAA